MNKNVNFKLKSLRVERDLTQEELGKHIGIHEATYNRKELGLSQLTLQEAKKNLICLVSQLIIFFLTTKFTQMKLGE